MRLVNQTTILRYNYDDPVFGTCSQSLQGGNHLRVFKQNGTQVSISHLTLSLSLSFLFFVQYRERRKLTTCKDCDYGQANSGAWFLAVSKEHNLAKNHMIVPNG